MNSLNAMKQLLEIYSRNNFKDYKINFKNVVLASSTERVVLLHDNVRPHVSKVIQKKIMELEWSLILYPANSLNLASSDYHLFRLLQNSLDEKKIQ